MAKGLNLCNRTEYIYFFFTVAPQPSEGHVLLIHEGFLDHTQRRTTVDRTPLDEWSARRRDPYLTTHNIQNGVTSTPPAEFEPTISAGERPQNNASACTATGTRTNKYTCIKYELSHIINYRLFFNGFCGHYQVAHVIASCYVINKLR